MGWHLPYPALLLVGATLLLAAVPSQAATYYVSVAGSDTNAGTSPRTPWRTLARVNVGPFRPGDRVLFRRGDRWRGQLRPQSGSPAGPVLYGAYGRGPKPVLLGSVDKSRAADWHNEGGNIWATGESAITQVLAALPAPTLTALPWQLYTEGGGAATGAVADVGPVSFRVDCTGSGSGSNHIQLYLMPFGIEAGKTYRLLFRAHASESFRARLPELMKATPPWTAYTSAPARRLVTVGTKWQTFCQLYEAGVTAADARLTFFLGGQLPAGATLWVDSLSFVESVPTESMGALPEDVGNLIFDGATCGTKIWQWHRTGPQHQDEFRYDEERQVVEMYSAGNPATHHRSIECALTRHIIDESGASYVVYENLDLRYGGAHGIGGGDTHHITVRDCDISFIGGGLMDLDGRPVRYGNGIEFWGGAHDNLVERCRLWEIYDAALTNQNNGPGVLQDSITYRNNVIWNSEYSFEYWNRPADSSRTKNIRFEHNTCVNAGSGWGHRQRPDPGGRHLCFYYSSAPAEGIVIRNNIFAGATDNAFYAPDYEPAQLAKLDIDHNLWLQSAGKMILLRDTSYDMAHFPDYQKELSLESHSVAAEPRFVDAAKRDYRLAPGSPGEGAGVTNMGKYPLTKPERRG
ncbi:MAG: hypothetical protein ABSD48_05975 [Armatimonadota bacterium]|jgi:hypothetical protein